MPRSTQIEIGVPAGYPELVAELKTRIRSAQVRAAFAVNRELILLYWSVGRRSRRCGRMLCHGRGQSGIKSILRQLLQNWSVAALTVSNRCRMRNTNPDSGPIGAGKCFLPGRRSRG